MKAAKYHPVMTGAAFKTKLKSRKGPTRAMEREK